MTGVTTRKKFPRGVTWPWKVWIPAGVIAGFIMQSDWAKLGGHVQEILTMKLNPLGFGLLGLLVILVMFIRRWMPISYRIAYLPAKRYRFTSRKLVELLISMLFNLALAALLAFAMVEFKWGANAAGWGYLACDLVLYAAFVGSLSVAERGLEQ